MRQLRVLWLLDSLTLGGAENTTVSFVQGLEPGRLDVRVAFLKSLGGNPLEEELASRGLSPVGLDARNLRDVAAFRRLTKLLRDREIDLIHAHLAYASLWGTVAGALHRIPTVCTFHVAPPPDPPWSREGMRRILRVRLTNGLARRSVAVSRAVREAWIREGLDSGKTEVIHNGVPVERFSGLRGTGVRGRVRRELGIPEGRLLLLTVTVLREGKGMEDLLAAVERQGSSGTQGLLAVAGEGPLREDLEKTIRSRGLEDRVRLLGFRRDVPDLLAAADLFVLPSRWDAFPTAILEAMAAGLPVVATRAGGIPEIVEDGRTGLLVSPGDPDQLAEALARLSECPELARRLGEAGRERARERFSLEAWRHRLLSLYEEILDAGREAA
ncbi:MAG: glycosyltransferase family 4 protein [Thermoanaerobaculia bacterium]|nr:glycosyltransferase family 4 protein [Thermoanaerobaculia bacterium]